MADTVSPQVRSRMMAGIGSANTKPEMTLRRALHARGFRYKLHDRTLPGRPDMVFPKRRAIILIHGCFWHGHDCHLFRLPGTRTDFWRDKISGNMARDASVRQKLLEAGWRVLEVWECTLRGREKLPLDDVIGRAESFLTGAQRHVSIGSPSNVSLSGR